MEHIKKFPKFFYRCNNLGEYFRKIFANGLNRNFGIFKSDAASSRVLNPDLKIKTIIIVLIINFLIIISLTLILAGPPTLPTRIYGKVLSSSNVPLEGVEISATYYENPETIKSIKTYTISSKNSLADNLKDKLGYYYFNGINAIPDSEIKLTVYNTTISVNSDPGFIVEADDLIAEKNTGLLQRIGDFVNNLFGQKEKLEEPAFNFSGTGSPATDRADQSNSNSINDTIQNFSTINNQSNFSSINNSINQSLNPIKVLNKTSKTEEIIYQNINKNKTQKFSPLIYSIPEKMVVCEDESLSLLFTVYHPEIGELEPIIKHNNLDSPFTMMYNSLVNPDNTTFKIVSEKLNKTYSKDLNYGYKNYSEDIFVTDGEYTDHKKIDITVVETDHQVLLDNLRTETVERKNLDFYKYKINAFDYDKNLLEEFEYMINSSKGISINNDSRGYLRIDKNQTENGIYQVNVCVKDKKIKNPYTSDLKCVKNISEMVCDNFNITIVDKDLAPVIKEFSPKDLNREIFSYEEINLNARFIDTEGNAPDSYWYVNNESVKYSESVFNDSYQIQVDCNKLESYDIKLEITDGLLNKTISWKYFIDKERCNKITKEKNWADFIKKLRGNLDIITIILFVIFVFILVILIVKTLIINQKIKSMFPDNNEQK